MRGHMLASISFDRTLRIWDLTTMKPLGVVHNADDTPLQCIEYCEVRYCLYCGFRNVDVVLLDPL